LSRKRFREAEALHQRVIAITEQARGPRHPDLVTALENYALFLRAVRRTYEAATLEQKAKAILAH